MKYHGGKMRNAIISLVVALAIILGSFYYGASNHVSYGQPEETETTVESTEDTESVAVSEEAEATVLDSPEILGADDSQEEEEAVILGTEDETQENEIQENEAQTEDVDETVEETQDGEEQQDSKETQDNEEKPQSKAGKVTEEDEKAEAEAAEKERYKAERLQAVTGVPTDISEYVSDRKINDFYVKHKGVPEYLVKGGIPQNSTTPIELGNGDQVYLDYKWHITKENIKHIQKDNYFRFELPKGKYFQGIKPITPKVYVKQYLDPNDKDNFKLINFGEYTIEDGYLVLRLTEETEYYINNIVDAIEEGQPKIRMTVKAEKGVGEIIIPGTDEQAEAKVKIKIIEENPDNNNQGTPGEWYTPGGTPSIAKSGKLVDEKTARWYIQINRDNAADMFDGDFDQDGNFVSTFNPDNVLRKNIILTDEIKDMVKDIPGATVRIKPETVAVYLDMLVPVKKDGKYVLSGGQAFNRFLYYHGHSWYDRFGFQDRIQFNNDRLSINFGDIPDKERTYIWACGNDVNVLNKAIDDATKNKNIKARISEEQAKIMKAVYSRLPIMHYTITFETEFEGLKIGNSVKNIANMNHSGGTEKIETEINVIKLDITDKPITKLSIIDIVVNKEWLNANGHKIDNPEYDSVEIRLLADGQPVAKYPDFIKIEKAKGWTYTFKDLKRYKGQNKPIEYTIEEKVPNGYKEHIMTPQEGGDKLTFEVINKQTPQTTWFLIKKQWQNENGNLINDTSKLPEIEVKVLMKTSTDSDFGEVPNRSDLKSIKLNKDNKWEFKVENLDKFDSHGKEIQYRVQEIKGAAGFLALKGGLVAPSKCGCILVNKKIPKIEIPFIKKWVDENNQTLKNTYKRMPDEIKIQLYANGQKLGNEVTVLKNKRWEYTFKDLPELGKDGKKITYTIREVGNVPGFTNDGDANENNNFTITNRLSKENVKITIKKIWKNENGGILSNPSVAELKVNVYSIIKETKKKVKIVTLNTGNQWQSKITDLPKYDSEGFEIKYVVEEDKIPQGYFMKSQDGANFTFTITNQKIPKINISVEKKWFNNGKELDNGYKLLPDKIQVRLLANGKVQETVEVFKSKQWKHTFKDLDKVDNKNNPINYTIEEVGNPAHFVLDKIEKPSENNFIIKNKKTEETVQLKINKVWLDTDGTTLLTETEKPNKVVVAIYKTKNGTETPVEQNIELNKKNNWSYTSKKLAKFDEVGDEVNYIIKETYVPDGYFRKSIEKNGLTFTVKNQKMPKIAVTVEKRWVDNAENPLKPNYNLKHDKVRVKLLANNVSIKEDDVLRSKNWKLTFDNLDKVDKEGKEIRYTVQEIGNYEGFVWLDTKEGLNHSFTITNKKTNEVVKLKINKEWKNETGNAAPADTEIPNEVVIAIYKMVAGKEVSVLEDIKLNRNNRWAYTSNDLAKLDDDGNLITYLVKETKVPDGYFRKYVPGQDGLTFTVINQKIPKINIKVEKKWVDKNNNTLKPDYKKIPDKVEVQVLVKGEVKDTIFVHKNQGWVGEFKDLPKLDQDGNVIDYEVREINVPEGFTVLSTVEDGENKFVITNKKTDEVVKIHITKKWVDLNNQAITDNNLLPENVSFQILANGAVKDTIYVYKNANWIYVSENLPKLDDNGVEIVYTIKEVNLPYGYVATVEKGSYELNFVVTNKHTPPSNPFVPPITPPTPPPDIIIPPAEIPFIPPTTPPTPFDGPDEDVIIDDDDVVKTDKEEDDEVIDDSVPLTNIPKTGVNNPLVYLIGISVLSLVMIFRLKSKK